MTPSITVQTILNTTAAATRLEALAKEVVAAQEAKVTFSKIVTDLKAKIALPQSVADLQTLPPDTASAFAAEIDAL